MTFITGGGRLLVGLVVLASAMFAQGPGQGQPVRVNPFVGTESVTSLLYYDGSGNLIYQCTAQPSQTPPHAATWAITPVQPQLTLTNIVVSANTGTATTVGNHGLQVGNLVTVVDPQTPTLAGTYYIQTVGSATTFTITTSGVGNATYTDAGLAVSTTASRSNDNVWFIQKYIYNGSNQLTNIQGSVPSGSYTAICDNRAQTTGATKITYQ